MTSRGLVLGGGGVLGAAWTIGALGVLEEFTGTDARTFDPIVGTSAGAVLAGLLGCGVSAGDLAGMLWEQEPETGGPIPPRPKLGLGSPALALRGMRHPRTLPPTAVLAGLTPEGRGSLDGVRDLIGTVAPEGWAPRDGVWIVAVDYEDGHRVVFGRDGAPAADLTDAVAASCAIPGWFAPVRIGGRRYVDGGAWSVSSVDVLEGSGLDEVYVVAPMVSAELDRPRSIAGKLERRWRARTTRRALREAEAVRATGTRVTVLGPGPADLRVIGANVMDVRRRVDVLETAARTTRTVLERGDELAPGS